MAEYVVNGAEPNETVLHSRTPNGYEAWHWLPVRERIVRCRDCENYSDHGGGGVCRCPLGDATAGMAWAKPDDFCSRGERRGDGQA